MKRTIYSVLVVLMLVLGVTACAGAATPEVVEPETADSVATEIVETTSEPVEEATIVAVSTPEGEVESGTPTPNETIVSATTPTMAVSTPETQPTMESEMPEGVIIIFKRDGGIAGFCDTLTVNAETVTLTSCNPNYPQGEMALDPAIQARLFALQEQYTTFTTSETDAPGAADAMTYTVEFYGIGPEAFTPDAQQEVQMIGQNLLDNFASDS
jgi:hypothetical protein